MMREPRKENACYNMTKIYTIKDFFLSLADIVKHVYLQMHSLTLSFDKASTFKLSLSIFLTHRHTHSYTTSFASYQGLGLR